MRRIVVFDGGCGGEIVAKFLAEELKVVEVISIVDWSNAPYEDRDIAEIVRLTERHVRSYIGKADLIVLGGYTVALALSHLETRYPSQKFVAVGVNFYRVLKTKNYPINVTALMNNSLISTQFCQLLRNNLPYSTIAIPDSSGWEDLANTGDLTALVLRSDLEKYFELKPKTCRELAAEKAAEKAAKKAEQQNILDSLRQGEISPVAPDPEAAYRVKVNFPRPLIRSDTVLILNTNLWDLNDMIESVFGYRVCVMDFRKKLLHDVCRALSFLGVDGERSK